MDFGALRSVLHRAHPGQRTWRMMCLALETFQDQDHLHHVVLPYVLEHLKGWPDSLRVMPHSWAWSALQGAPQTYPGVSRALYWGPQHSPNPILARPTHVPLGSDALARLLDLPDAAHWTRLVLDDAFQDARRQLDVLTQALGQRLSSVHTLHLHTTFLGVEHCDSLIDAIPQSALRALELQYKRLDMARLGTLLASGSAQLEHLGLPNARCSAAMMLMMADTMPSWPNLRSINLQGNPLDRRSYQVLGDLIHQTKLDHLDLRRTTHRPQHFLELGSAHPLKSLSISNVEDTTFDWDQLLQKPWLSQLEHLHVEHTSTGDALCAALSKAPCAKTLRSLTLHHSKLSELGVGWLAQHAPFESLERLDLSHHRIYTHMLDALGQAKHLTKLKHLALQCEFMSHQALGELAHTENLPALEHIDLSDSNMSFQQRPISQWLQKPSLRRMTLHNVPIGGALRAEIVQRAHNVEVQTGHYSPHRTDASIEAIEDGLLDCPSEQVWEALSKVFHTLAKHRYTPEVVTRVAHALDRRWPNHLRRPTDLWWTRLSLQQEMPVWWSFIRHIYLRNDIQRLAKLVDQEHMRYTQELRLDWRAHITTITTRATHPQVITRLLNSVSVEGLRTLSLQCDFPQAHLWEGITRSKNLSNLSALNVESQKLTPEIAHELGDWTQLPKLTHLHIRQRIDGFGPLEDIPALPLIRSLKRADTQTLSLSGLHVTPEAAHMLNKLELPDLRTLTLEHNLMHDEAMEALWASPPTWATHLRTLNINQSSRVTGSSLPWLARAATQSTLRAINLTGCTGLDPEDVQRLRDALPDSVQVYHSTRR